MAWVNLKKGKNMFFVFCVGGGEVIDFFYKESKSTHFFAGRGGGIWKG